MATKFGNIIFDEKGRLIKPKPTVKQKLQKNKPFSRSDPIDYEQHLLELGGSFEELPNEPLTAAERRRMSLGKNPKSKKSKKK